MNEETRQQINEELGRVSGIFMSQGNTRAGDIVMPTEELLQSAERIEAIFDQALQAEKERLVSDLENLTHYCRSKFSPDTSRNETEEERSTEMLVKKDILNLINHPSN